VIHRFDVVSIGVDQKRSEISRVILALARRAIVAAAGRETRVVNPAHHGLIFRLKRQMDVTRRLFIRTERIDPQLVAREVSLVVAADGNTQRAEHRAIEPLRAFQIACPQMNVIDQPADVKLAHSAPP